MKTIVGESKQTMSENSNTSNVQLPGIINSILGQWADDIIERVNESVRFLGVTTTVITDGSTVSTIVIDGQSVSVSTGDIAVYSGNYFLFYSSAWHAGGGGSSSIAAEDVSYDNTTSGLTATDVQDAVDEVVSDLSDKMDKANPTGTGSLSLNRKANTTIGTNSVALGVQTTASGSYSYAEGAGTTASGAQSHAEGASTTASGSCAHAEGVSTTASGDLSHAEGNSSHAEGNSSHAEGASTTASNNQAHAEGGGTIASGAQSHAEGASTIASGNYSHAEGSGTIAAGSSQHAGGKYNVEDNNNTYAEIIGNGTANNARSNARTLDWSGNETIAGDLTFNGSTSLSDTLDDKTTYIECTQAQYDAWEQAGTVESDVSYYITDQDNPNVASATSVMYDGTSSGLSATNVQDAIDEIAPIKDDIGNIDNVTLTTSDNNKLLGSFVENNDVVVRAVEFGSNFTIGSVIWNTTNVTGDQSRNQYIQVGKLVVLSLEFTPLSGKIANGYIIATGLPIPNSSMGSASARFVLMGGTNKQLGIDSTGQLIWYFPGNASDLSRIEINAVYIAE